MEDKGNLRMVSRSKTCGIVRRREQDNTEFMYFSFHCADAFFDSGLPINLEFLSNRYSVSF